MTTRVYDTFDRLTQVTDAFGKPLRYGYDANGNRTSLTDPDGKVTTYTFDDLNRLVTATTAGGMTQYRYDRSSLKTRVIYPNGTESRYTYDGARRYQQVRNSQGVAVISQYDYTYDANGNRLTQIEINGGAAETTRYGYDTNDRMTQVTYPDATVTYSYDAAFNRTGERSTDNTTSAVLVDKAYRYNNRNQLTDITDHLNAPDSVTYQYDANGNQVIKSKNGVTTTFVYDVRDKLLTVRQAATTLSQFFYDYGGMRVAKTGEHGLVRYTYDGASVLTQHDSAGTTLAKFDYGPDVLLSLSHATQGRQFYHFDALGSVVNLSRPDAAIQARYQYDAWGNFRATTGSSWNAFAFTGHERDNETGLYYFKARFYDPDTGRFLSQDPYLGDVNTAPSLHRYLYAYANPGVFVDLTGYAAVLNEAQIKTVVGAADAQQGLRLRGGKHAAIRNFGEQIGVNARDTGPRGRYFSISPEDVQKYAQIIQASGAGKAPTRLMVREGDESPDQAFDAYLDDVGDNLYSRYLAGEAARAAFASPGVPADIGSAYDSGIERAESAASATWGSQKRASFTRWRESQGPVLKYGGLLAQGTADLIGDVYENSAKAGSDQPRHIRRGARAALAVDVAAAATGVSTIKYLSKVRRSGVGVPDKIPEGIVYRRTDLSGEIAPYGGQAKSEARFIERQAEHARANPDADFEFEIVGRAEPGVQLDVLEHNFIQELTGGVAARKSPLVSNLKDPVGAARRVELGLPEPKLEP